MTYISRTIDHSDVADEDESLRWTPSKQHILLETLSFYGNVRIAAAQCCMSTRSCYNLRTRHDGAEFHMGWNAAILIAHGRLIDELMIRAIDGQRDTIERDEDGRVVARHRFDNRLALGLLYRLDRVADAPVKGSQSAEARLIAQDFEAFLDLVETGGRARRRRPSSPRACRPIRMRKRRRSAMMNGVNFAIKLIPSRPASAPMSGRKPPYWRGRKRSPLCLSGGGTAMDWDRTAIIPIFRRRWLCGV